MNSIFFKSYPLLLIILIINLRNTVSDIFIAGESNSDFFVLFRASLFVFLGAISFYRLIKNDLHFNQIEKLFLFYLMYCFFSAIYSSSPFSTFIASFELAVIYLIIKDFSNIFKSNSLKLLAYQHTYFIIFVLFAILFEIDFLTSLNTESFTSLYSIEIAAQSYAPIVFLKNNPSKMASIALMCFLYFLFEGKRKLFLIPTFYMIFIAQSRAILLVTLISILFYFFGNRYKLFTSFIIISFLLIIIFNQSIFSILFQSDYFSRGEDLGYFLSGNNRFDLWAKSIEYIQQNPIFGIGYNNSPFLKDPLFFWTKGSHNFFLSLFLYLGFIGFSYFSFLNYKLIKNIFKIHSDKIRNLFLCIIFTIFLNSFVGDTLSSSRSIYTIYFIYIFINYDNYFLNHKALKN